MKHWLVLLIACGFAGSSMGINMNIMGVFYQPVAEDLNILVGTFAFQATLAVMFLSIMGLFINRILQYITFKQMAIIGIVISTLATAAMAFESTPAWFNILGSLRGIGSGLIGIVPFTILLNNWFDEKNGLAISITSAFAGIIGVILSPVLTWTIGAYGWRNSFLILSVLFVVFNLPVLLIPVKLNPRDEGLLPYGFKEPEVSPEAVANVEFKDEKVNYKSIFFITLVFIALFYTFATGISQNLPGFAVSNGFDLEFGAILLSAAMLSNIIFKLSFGSLTGKLGGVKSTVISSTLLIIALLILLFGSSSQMLILGAFLYGSCYFVPSVALPILTREFFGKNLSNRVYPIISLLSGIGGAYSVTMVSFIYDFTGSFSLANWLAIIFTVISIILLIVSYNKQSSVGGEA